MHVAVRADGGPSLGFGHLVRTARLADALVARGHEVSYLTSTPAATSSVVPADVTVESLRNGTPGEAGIDALLPRIRDGAFDALVLDVGGVPLEVQRRLTETDVSLALVVDDTGGTVCCDLLHNGHVYASPTDYEWVGTEPTWCVGGEFVVLDRALSDLARQTPPWRDRPAHALITMGGSDVRGTTPSAVRAFDELPVAVDVVVGPGFENGAAIRTAARESDCKVTLHSDPPDMASLMFRADLAVTALGITAYELLALGTPLVGLVQAPDQRPKARALREADAALVLDPDAGSRRIHRAVSSLVADPDRRRSLRERGRALVGADGCERFADAIETLE